ncbi:MAG: hypothetical protein IKL15_01110 [Mycoplasmataceae bacterium]|nr:hypothetical protein [Mycoplasmataceae bacterium]MBR3571250.1 hypothetical protein [Mycoplasmataceae bacterium]
MQYKKIVEYSENNISIPALIGFPTLFLIISIISFLFLIISFSKKKIGIKTTICWLISNLFFFTISLYLFIIGLIEIFKPNFYYLEYNFFIVISEKLFGIDGQFWILIFILLFLIIEIPMIVTFAIKQNQNIKKINDLNRNFAILKGKIAIEIEDLAFDSKEISLDELKHLLEEKLAKEKIKIKFKNKMEKLQQKQNIEQEISDPLVDTNTLLNMDSNKKEE